MYKGYVLKNEFVKFFGKDYEDVLKKIFCCFEVVDYWSWEEFKRVSLEHCPEYPENAAWYISQDYLQFHLSGWNMQALDKENYFHVTPQKFVNNILGEKMNKETYTAKPRFHKKRKPVPSRKKTDITVFYGTGEKYTIKNAKSLVVHKQTFYVSIATELKNGFSEGKTFIFTTDNVDSLLVKTPKGSYTLDYMGDGEYVLTQENTHIALTNLAQDF